MARAVGATDGGQAEARPRPLGPGPSTALGSSDGLSRAGDAPRGPPAALVSDGAPSGLSMSLPRAAATAATRRRVPAAAAGGLPLMLIVPGGLVDARPVARALRFAAFSGWSPDVSRSAAAPDTAAAAGSAAAILLRGSLTSTRPAPVRRPAAKAPTAAGDGGGVAGSASSAPAERRWKQCRFKSGRPRVVGSRCCGSYWCGNCPPGCRRRRFRTWGRRWKRGLGSVVRFRRRRRPRCRRRHWRRWRRFGARRRRHCHNCRRGAGAGEGAGAMPLVPLLSQLLRGPVRLFECDVVCAMLAAAACTSLPSRFLNLTVAAASEEHGLLDVAVHI